MISIHKQGSHSIQKLQRMLPTNNREELSWPYFQDWWVTVLHGAVGAGWKTTLQLTQVEAIGQCLGLERRPDLWWSQDTGSRVWASQVAPLTSAALSIQLGSSTGWPVSSTFENTSDHRWHLVPLEKADLYSILIWKYSERTPVSQGCLWIITGAAQVRFHTEATFLWASSGAQQSLGTPSLGGDRVPGRWWHGYPLSCIYNARVISVESQSPQLMLGD